MYDVRLLQVLREIALRGSFSAAAEALNYTQPAVSQQIARLERQAGVTLVDRTSRGIRLTAAGQVLLRRTERVLAELQAAEDELGELAAQARGRLRVAAFSTAAGTIVPEAVAAFRELRPAVEIELHLFDPPDSLPMLARGEIDIALCEIRGFSRDVSLNGLTVEHLFDDPLFVSLPGGHPLATRESVALGELCDEDWILVTPGGACEDTNIVMRACREAGFEPRGAYFSHDYFAIQGLVASGMGVALVPALALVTPRLDVAVRPVAGRVPLRGIAAAFAGEPTGAAATMLECLRQASAAYQRPEPLQKLTA
jgi:DNA-binding transcriptional LysR family regulator